MNLNLMGREVFIRKEFVAAGAVLIILAAALAGFIIRRNNNPIIIDTQSGYQASTVLQEAADIHEEISAQSEASKDNADDEEIKVYVVGCVKKAGIVTLKKGQIIDDAVKAAGGFTDEADIENINLAYRLDDNTMIKILSKKETQKMYEGSTEQASEGDLDKKSGTAVTKGSGSAVAGIADKAEEKRSLKININAAGADELDELPGVGEKTASDIIEYRKKNGKFEKIEDIMNVSRIGQSRFESMKDLITVD